MRRSVVGIARACGGRAAVALAVALAVACRTGDPAAPPQPPRSLLLVTIDTLRADRVGVYGSRDGATPNLDALATRGVVFEEARASTPLTLPSHSTILSGLEPLRHLVRNNGSSAFPEDVETLATRLKGAGHATGAFVGAYVLDRRFGLDRGFDRYDDQIARVYLGGSLLQSERPCEEVAESARAWLDSGGGPFFAWVHFFDPHAPYDPPEPLRTRFAGRPYEGEVARADACLLPLLEGAERRADGRLVIAVTSDHGEGLGDHGEATHGFFIYESTLRVPLVIAGDGVPRGERRAGLARTVDLLPTLLGRLGLPQAAGLDGQDLFAGPAPDEAYAETVYPEGFGWAPLRALRRGALKLVEAPRPELYDLAADPQESRDLASERAPDIERLRAALLTLRQGERTAAPRVIDPAVAQRLRALGYVSGPATAAKGEARKDPKDALPLWQQFEQATWAEIRGEREKALQGFRALVAHDPDNVTLRRALALALRRAGRAGEAVQALADLEKTAPGDAAAWHDLAAALSETGDSDGAIRAEQRATALNPMLPEPFNHLGRLLAQRGRLAEALRAFDRATALDPTGAQARANRADVLLALGRAEEAAADFRRAAELDPRSPDPPNGLGVLEAGQGRFDAAAAAFEQALTLDGGHQEARLNLALVEAQRGNRARARALASAVARDTSGSVVGRRARGLLAELK